MLTSPGTGLTGSPPPPSQKICLIAIDVTLLSTEIIVLAVMYLKNCVLDCEVSKIHIPYINIPTIYTAWSKTDASYILISLDHTL